MNQIKPENDLEIKISNKAIEACRKTINRMNKEKLFLETKEFHLGEIVIKKETRNSLEIAFNVGKGNIGKIVGWDFESNYYRVFYSKNNSYIGVRETEIEKYNGMVPDEVLNHDPYEIDLLILRF